MKSFLVFCMFWLGFVCPRSYPGWINRLVNLQTLDLEINKLTDTPSLSPILASSQIGWLVYCMCLPSFLSDFRVTCVLLRILIAFCGVVLLFASRCKKRRASVASGTSSLRYFHPLRRKRRPRLRPRLLVGRRPRWRGPRRRPDQDLDQDQNASSKLTQTRRERQT